MHHPSILIVGYGHVGRQMGKYFQAADYVDVDGIIRRVQDDEPADARDVYALGFVCVPTPQGQGGHCDVSIVRQAWLRWSERARYWCIKSTVTPGTTESLGDNACFSPEFYGETTAHPLAGISASPFVILGGPEDVTRAFADAWACVTNSYTRIYQTDAKTAELCKLMENAWIATKVTFCNEMYDVAQAAGVDWHTLRELWLADPRVSRSHTWVFPHDRGWGGSCLPKDTANLCAWARRIGKPAQLLEAVRALNGRQRCSK